MDRGPYRTPVKSGSCFAVALQRRPARPRLTAILDDFNGAVAGYAVNLGAPSALQTALALRQAIWREADPPWTVCSS